MAVKAEEHPESGQVRGIHSLISLSFHRLHEWPTGYWEGPYLDSERNIGRSLLEHGSFHDSSSRSSNSPLLTFSTDWHMVPCKKGR